MSVFLFVCPIITHESLDWFASNFDWETRENHGNVVSLVLDAMLSGSTLKRKIAKIVIYDQARVNGGSNYKYPGQRWVLKLVV